MKSHSYLSITLATIVLVGLFVYFHFYHVTPPALDPDHTSGTSTTEITVPPVFSWRYTEASSLNPDGNPQTNVFLDALYQNGETKSKLIGVENGSCNALPESGKADTDVLPHTSVIQCYYAGQGFLYKIVRGERSYQILQKEFEEGSPDYVPPEQSYKPVNEFPL